MHQLERVTNLLTLLLSARRHVTFDEIRNELRGQYPDNLVAARAAFERDKSLLRDEGVPIDSVVLGGDQAGTTGYRILRSDYELGDIDLEPDEAAALRVAVSTIRMGQSWGVEALWKVDMESMPIEGGGAAPVVAANLPVDPRLPFLHRSLAARCVVSFDYNGKPREVRPYGLLARDGWWYLVGHDRSVDDLRTFRVDRISGEVEVGQGGAFTIPDGFDVRAVFPADPKLLPDNVDVGSDVAEVLFDASDVGVVLNQYGSEAVVSERPDGSKVFAIPCSNVRAFDQWLLGFVERAEVLSPPLLRQHVVEWLESMGARA
jgi:predicted DNA-binding transcriptional regulator YafY